MPTLTRAPRLSREVEARVTEERYHREYRYSDDGSLGEISADADDWRWLIR